MCIFEKDIASSTGPFPKELQHDFLKTQYHFFPHTCTECSLNTQKRIPEVSLGSSDFLQIKSQFYNKGAFRTDRKSLSILVYLVMINLFEKTVDIKINLIIHSPLRIELIT